MRSVPEEVRLAGRLTPTHSLCRHLRAPSGTSVFTDGPYVETREHLGRFAVVDMADEDEAHSSANRLVLSRAGP
jgi:hypothetical protein